VVLNSLTLSMHCFYCIFPNIGVFPEHSACRSPSCASGEDSRFRLFLSKFLNGNGRGGMNDITAILARRMLRVLLNY
jgi:hypothetical protein